MIVCTQLDPSNKKQHRTFLKLMHAYIRELERHRQKKTSKRVLKKWTKSVIETGCTSGRHLCLVHYNGKPVGFFYGKVDREGDRGEIRPGWGYVMEFFVKKRYRRQGIGTEMNDILEALLRQDGAEHFYLTADPVTGKTFWIAQGYTPTGILSDENKQEFFEKQ